ncbi:DNA-binding transcriptional regulator [Dyella sp. LX-66]|uniref:XylR family transcriptional regulator n=1 Tax=unclassified Dyella TaxID=2634549 RepID=UPI001BE0EBD5|nr:MULTISPECIES: DNA-binding transcriptional regulator [unclassified Dyella]MBT2117623.1 DNA-binding transcriptional regulator [Dyella sp. LX-1]MBT2141373.1 DNA-binding transcriptional regulator [Dyella sp. LX-66]
MSPHRIALLFNANKVYDRQVIAGIGQYLKSTRVVWDLFLEEDFRCRTLGIQHWRGDGIIADFDDPTVEEALAHLSIPVVAIGGSYADDSRYPANIPYVATDNAKLVRVAYDHLIEQGLQRFAFYGLPPSPGNRWAQEREDAFLRMIAADGLEGSVYRGSPTSAGGWGRSQEDMVAWVRSLPKPIGVVAVTDARARQLLQACVVADVPIPEQIAVVGIDNDPMAQLLSRIPLTSVIQGAEEMGRMAAQVLHQMLHGGDCSSTRVLVPPVGLSVQASSQHEPLRSPYVMRAKHYIRQYACLGIKTEQVADYVGISRTLLEEHFKRELKQTVHQAILEHKLEMARSMLVDNSIPLADVAVRCGFTSLQYMYAVFRREFNCTPRQFLGSARA